MVGETNGKQPYASTNSQARHRRDLLCRRVLPPEMGTPYSCYLSTTFFYLFLHSRKSSPLLKTTLCIKISWETGPRSLALRTARFPSCSGGFPTIQPSRPGSRIIDAGEITPTPRRLQKLDTSESPFLYPAFLYSKESQGNLQSPSLPLPSTCTMWGRWAKKFWKPWLAQRHPAGFTQRRSRELNPVFQIRL